MASPVHPLLTGRSVCHNFLKEQKLHLHAPIDRSTCSQADTSTRKTRDCSSVSRSTSFMPFMFLFHEPTPAWCSSYHLFGWCKFSCCNFLLFAKFVVSPFCSNHHLISGWWELRQNNIKIARPGLWGWGVKRGNRAQDSIYNIILFSSNKI